jgi:hypothetical protein
VLLCSSITTHRGRNGMVEKINTRLLSKIHLDRILSDDARREELISIISFYFDQHPNTKSKWENRYNSEIKFKNKKPKGKKHEKSEGFKVISNDSPDDIVE